MPFKGARVWSRRPEKRNTGQKCHCGGNIIIVTSEYYTGRTLPMIGGSGRYDETEKRSVKKCDKCGCLYD